ncbi:hypothetical protein BJ165DRAFT_1000317 [Panaeolus papilionaceus]|nr:hypothetical protein BJ165DRAFT_1000317 [Panaeolus papilionaceus]
MRDRASSEISTHSSLEFSYSDVESISSLLNMTDINIEKDAHSASPAPPTFPTGMAKGDLEELDAPLVPQVVDVLDQPRPESKSSTKNTDKLHSDSDFHLAQLDMDLNAINTLTQPDQNTVASRTKKKEMYMDLATLERDPVYFCEIALLVAEDRVFCVPKGGLLEHGTYFQSLFGNQPHDDVKDETPATGSLGRSPIFLQGISKVHFHNFLRVIYPFHGVDVPSGDEHWLGILDLATRWGFQEVRLSTRQSYLPHDHVHRSRSEKSLFYT